MNDAIIITGTICSGKSTISENIKNKLNIEFINETNVSPNGIFGMKYAIKNNNYKDILLIEHAEILNFMDDIKIYFKNIIIILLNVSDNILIENLNLRKSKNITGDYLKVNILEMKKSIETQFNKIEYDCKKYIANINLYEDYKYEYNNIIDFIINHKSK